MKTFICCLVFFLLLSNVQAANIYDLDVGDGVYLEGIMSDELVYITRIDVSNNRVKIRRSTDSTTKWVRPSSLISREASTTNDIGRTAIGVGIMVCLLNPEACKNTGK